MKQIRTVKNKANSRKTKSKKQQTEISEDNKIHSVHSAIQNNDLGTLEALIASGANLDKYNKDKDTPILLAIKENNIQIVERLLEEGVDLKRTDANGDLPLSVAIKLEYQECIDLIIEHETSVKNSSEPGTINQQDNSADFVNTLIKLLTAETASIDVPKSDDLTKKVMLLLQQYLDLKKIAKNFAIKLNADINYKISQFLNSSKINIKPSQKDILNLARKIIVIIQNSKTSLPADLTWTLNKIESLIEEKIVTSNGDYEQTLAHIFAPSNFIKKEKSTYTSADADWYTQNGYKNFNEFVRINSSGAGHVKFLKFSDVNKEQILRKTSSHTTEILEITTIKPLHPTTNEELSLLISNATKRIEEEQFLLNHSPDELKAFNELLDKAKSEPKISIDESLQLDKILRPGKKNKIHMVHFHHTNSYELFWNDLTKEAFFTGATIHLFNYTTEANKVGLIYSGIAIINKLLDEDVHPDKIILQGYGNGHLILQEVKNQFQKRGINLSQINYQHPLFFPTMYPDFICDHRNLHIYANNTKALKKGNNSNEFSQFAEHIIKNLSMLSQDMKCADLTAVVSNNYSLPQVINTFISSSQHFFTQYICYKNPPLPNERLENIFGVINI